MEIRIAQTEDEVEAAMELVYRSFPISYYDAKTLKDAHRQYLPNEFAKERFIVALENNQIVGTYRAFPKKMIIAGIETDYLGGGHYCIDKINVKVKTLGIKLYNEATKILSKSSYPFGVGSTRRVLGNYYYWLGRIGIDTYAKCKIEKLRILNRSSLPQLKFVEKFNQNNVDKYESLRKHTYLFDWVMILRYKDDWRWIGYKVRKLKLYKFFEIYHNNDLIGYFITANNSFVDYGLENNNFEDYAKAMVCSVSNIIPIELLTFHLSPQNRLLKSLGLTNISYSMRYVPDEGISAIAYNKVNLVNLFCDVVSNLREKSRVDSNFKLGYKLSFRCEALKIKPAFNPDKMSKEETQLLLNNLFLGTCGPFSLNNFDGPSDLPYTFHRINDIDVT